MRPAFEPDWDDPRVRAVADVIESGPRGAVEGPFVPLLNVPDLADVVQRLGAELRFGGSLPADVREVAILVVASCFDARFIRDHHEPLAVDAGLTQDQVASLRRGEVPTEPRPAVRIGAELAGQLTRERRLEPGAARMAAGVLGAAGVVELVTLVGYYGLLAGVLISCAPPDLQD